MSPVRGDTIENFVILNSSNPSVSGGTFFRGGTYSGSFSVDTSLIPSNGNRAMFSLHTFDIAIAVPTLNIDAGFSPAIGATATFDAEAALDIGGSFPSLIQVDNIEFHGFAGAMLDVLLIEPVGIFQGGLVAFAQGQGPFGGVFFDVSGSAIVIDPAVVPTPEPNVGLLLAGGLCLFAGLAKRRVLPEVFNSFAKPKVGNAVTNGHSTAKNIAHAKFRYRFRMPTRFPRMPIKENNDAQVVRSFTCD